MVGHDLVMCCRQQLPPLWSGVIPDGVGDSLHGSTPIALLHMVGAVHPSSLVCWKLSFTMISDVML